MSVGQRKFHLLIGLFVSLIVSQCRQATPPENRPSVYGGEAVPDGEYPLVVGLIEVTSRSEDDRIERADLLCTGTLIHPKVVLTAGHCLHPEAVPEPPPVDPQLRWLPVSSLRLWTQEPTHNEELQKSLWVFQGSDLTALTERIKAKELRLKDLPLISKTSVETLPRTHQTTGLARVARFKIFPTLWVDPLGHGDLGLVQTESPLWYGVNTSSSPTPSGFSEKTDGTADRRFDSSQAPEMPDNRLTTQGPLVFPWQDSEIRRPWYGGDEVGFKGFKALIVGYGRREDGQWGQKYQAPLRYQRRMIYGSTKGSQVVLGGSYPMGPPPPFPLEPSDRITDSCDGDSGGPLLLVPEAAPGAEAQEEQGTLGSPKPVLWGVASYGITLECGRGTAFQSVAQGRCWIRHSLDALDFAADHEGELPTAGVDDLHPQSAGKNRVFMDDLLRSLPEVDPRTGQCRLELSADAETPPPTSPQARLRALRNLCITQKPWSSFQTLWALADSIGERGLLLNSPKTSSPPIARDLLDSLTVSPVEDKNPSQPSSPSSSGNEWNLWCEQLSDRLFQLQAVDLEGRGLFDARPLYLLSSAKVLKLGGNQFEKIEPFVDRPRLEILDVTGNLVDDWDAFWARWAFAHPGDPPDGRPSLIGKNRQYQNRSPLMRGRHGDPGQPFLTLCQGAESEPLKKTFNALFARTQSLSCDQLWRRILMVDKLLLKQRSIIDITPLASLTHLISLDLSGNPDLIDIRPLQGLESLKVLKLKGTGVQDLSPLLPLVKRNGLTIEM